MLRDGNPGGRGIELNPLPFGNYYLLERLAVGGMAEVYLAKCFGVAGFERLVALKRILPNIAEDDEFIAMFIDEAKIAGQLSHANVAQIFDLGKINNSYFIAMEYISGHDLRALWDRSRESGGIPLALACYVVQRLCEGLDYAHRRRDNRGRPLGIIHRDVSPQNVLLSYDGDIKVIDFGIAKAANRMVRTQTGILKGKFAYMAPEQARGEPIDHRADIFAIGVMLYELLTGERAFKAESDFALLEKVRRVDIVPPRKLRAEVPRDLERIIYKAMSKDAKDRYAWASAMRADLDRFMVDHDLSYNKEELAAYVRRCFKSEHEEEQRRLKLYQGYKLTGDEEVDDEDGPSALTPRAEPADAEHATVVRSDLSSEPDEARAGTEVAPDASTRQPFAPEHTRPEPPAPGESRVDPGLIDPDTSKDLRHGESRARRLVSSGDILPWEEERAAPPPPGQTMVDVSRPAFSEAGEPADDDAGEDAIDETMVDNNPVDEASSDDARVAHEPPRERRKEGTRPDVRGSSLGQVLGTSPALLPLERERARRQSGLDELVAPSNGSLSNGALGGARLPPPPPPASTRNQARIETEHFRENARAELQRGVPRSTVTAVVAAVALVAVVVGLATGFWLGERMQTASTFVVVTPGPAEVQLGGETLCATTPCAVNLPPGKHDLMFVKEGLGAVSKTIDVGTGTTVVDVRLQPRLAGLRLVTTPPGAQVWLDGKKLSGVTPLALPELTAGDTVKLKLALSDEYDALEELFEVRDTKGVPLRFELPARETEWKIEVEPEDAVVLIDDERPRVGRAKLVVERGKSRIVSVERPGCATTRMTLLGNGKREADAPVTLSCRTFDARITINGTRGADVEIDGVPLAKRVPVRELPIPAGEHLVVAKRRGHHMPFVVEVEPGQTATVTAKMR